MLEAFEQAELLEILCALIKRKSENSIHTEEDVARYIQALLQRNGIDAELLWADSGRPNVMAHIKGDVPGPTLLYNGHLDVVPVGSDWTVDPYACIMREGKLFGRGTADMKSGIAAMLYAAIILKRRGIQFAGELILLFNVDEECVNLGMRHFLKSDITADYAIIGEPTELDICIAHKGVGRYRVRTAGTPGHAAYVIDPDNAITKMSKLLSIFETLGDRVKTHKDPLLGSGSLTITKISGGTAINIIPAMCEIEIDRRVLPGETQQSVMAEMSKALNAVVDGINFGLENYLFIPASYVAESHVLVQKLLAANNQVRQQAAQIKIFSATCEAPFLSVDKGIPTVIFGPGSLKQAHTKDEYVEVKQVVTAVQIFVKLVQNLLQK